MQTIVAIDPGTKESGVAIFVDGKLEELTMLGLFDLGVFIQKNNYFYVIEDLMKIKGIYGRNKHKSIPGAAKISQNVGQVKQTFKHIIEHLERNNRSYEGIPPTTGNWGTIKPVYGNRVLAERTGWKGRSNKDTRSAAFFGWLYLQRQRVNNRSRS